MVNETMVTFQGWIGTEVTDRYVGEAVVASFRVASTPRKYNKMANGWVDGETNWYTVNAWRSLGRNCIEALKKGDAVVVHGRLSTQVYEDDEKRRFQTMVVEATSVGHDLNKGTSSFTKTTVGAGGEADDGALREFNAELGIGGPQISSDGQALGDFVTEEPSKEPAA